MTDVELRIYLEDWVKDYCKNPFESGTPSGVVLFLDKAVEFIKAQNGVKSETLGDWSITLSVDYPESMLKLIKPYKRIGVV